jgi:hypothetical protein
LHYFFHPIGFRTPKTATMDLITCIVMISPSADFQFQPTAPMSYHRDGDKSKHAP